MDSFTNIVIVNFLAIAVFYVLFGQVANRFKKRITAAANRLSDTKIDSSIRNKFLELSDRSFQKASQQYWLVTIILLAALFIGFAVYATAVEPGAQFAAELILECMIYGIALVGCLVISSIVYARCMQVLKLNRMIDDLIASHPRSPVFTEVKELIRIRKSETGISVLGFVGVFSSLIVGAGFLVLFYTAAQAAIECARSSKCI